MHTSKRRHVQLHTLTCELRETTKKMGTNVRIYSTDANRWQVWCGLVGEQVSSKDSHVEIPRNENSEFLQYKLHQRLEGRSGIRKWNYMCECMKREGSTQQTLMIVCYAWNMHCPYLLLQVKYFDIYFLCICVCVSDTKNIFMKTNFKFSQTHLTELSLLNIKWLLTKNYCTAQD